MTLAGADLSSNNTAASVADALATDFVIVKASQGTGYVWTGGQAVAQKARTAGKLVGWYHYAVVKNDPAADAKAFVAAAKALPGEVLALDYEPYGTQANADGSAPVLVDWIVTFSQTVTALTGAPCWLYTNESLGKAIRAKATAEQSAALSGMPLWKAYYQADPGSLIGWDAITCWQYSSAGGLDKNTFYGDADFWRALAVPQGGPVARTTWRGVTVDTRTAKMLDAVNALLPDIPIWPSQGSYNTSVTASGGTHSGGGAVDIALFVDGKNLTDAQARQIETAGRRVGFAAYYRPAIPGTWPRHVHMIAIGQPDMSVEASYQVRDYKAGKDGLLPRSTSTGISLNPDTGTRAYVNATWEKYIPPAPAPPIKPTLEADMLPKIITAKGGDDTTSADDGLMLATPRGFVALLSAAEVATAQRYVNFCANPKDSTLYMAEVEAIQSLLKRAA